eukprot:749928-Rhodomonas_salina.3
MPGHATRRDTRHAHRTTPTTAHSLSRLLSTPSLTLSPLTPNSLHSSQPPILLLEPGSHPISAVADVVRGGDLSLVVATEADHGVRQRTL